MTDFTTKIDGVEVTCRVTHYSPYQPARGMTGPMEDAEEDIPSEFEFELYDKNGQRLQDIEEALGDKDVERLQDEFELLLTTIRNGLDFD